MKIRRFFGKDMREALSQVKAELGSDAVIMSNRKVADGIELVAAYDKEPKAKIKLNTRHDAVKPSAQKATPSLSEIIGDDGPDTLRALLEKQAAEKAAAAGSERQNPAVSPAPQTSSAFAGDTRGVNQQPAASHDEEAFSFADVFSAKEHKPAPVSQMNPDFKAAESQQSAGAPASELDAIKEELASLRSVLQYQVADLMDAKKQRQRPVHSYLTQCLTGMGLSASLAEQLVHYTPSQYTEREAWIYLLNLLANRLNVSGNDILTQTGVVALVGPTGTGKTTTVAKLAARYAQKYGADQVAMITIDTYRIAAYEQLATYGKIIGCTTRKAQSSEELAELLFQVTGAIAGLGGMIHLAGSPGAQQLNSGFSAQYGLSGFIVAAIAGGSFLGLVVGGFLIAGMFFSGLVLQTRGLSVYIVLALYGIILIGVAVGEMAARYRLVRAESEVVARRST